MNWEKAKSKLQQDLGGKVDLIISSLFFLLASFNLLHGIFKSVEIKYYIIYVTPYFIASILTYLLGWRIVIGVILIVLGVGIMAIPGSDDDLGASIFFCLSAHMIKKNKYNIFLCILTVILLTIRSTIYEDSIPGSLTIILGYFTLYGLYYFIAYKPSIQKQSKIHTLTEDENQLLTYLAYEDISQKEAGALMELKPNKANDILKQVREKLGVTSMYSVIRLIAEHNKSKNRKDNSSK